MKDQEFLERLQEIRENCNRAAQSFGHRPEEITLLGVTKTVEADGIRQAIRAGILDLGENRVQGINRKLDAFAGARIHMIGRLQRNKVRQLPQEVSLVQSIDRLSLAQELDRIGKREHRIFHGLIQVSMAHEEQKGGVDPDQVEGLCDACEALENLEIHGLLFVAPNTQDQDALRLYFRKMRGLFEKIGAIGYNTIRMDILSMGMTNDYRIALEEGATMVRIGRALFSEDR